MVMVHVRSVIFILGFAANGDIIVFLLFVTVSGET